MVSISKAEWDSSRSRGSNRDTIRFVRSPARRRWRELTPKRKSCPQICQEHSRYSAARPSQRFSLNRILPWRVNRRSRADGRCYRHNPGNRWPVSRRMVLWSRRKILRDMEWSRRNIARDMDRHRKVKWKQEPDCHHHPKPVENARIDEPAQKPASGEKHGNENPGPPGV